MAASSLHPPLPEKHHNVCSQLLHRAARPSAVYGSGACVGRDRSVPPFAVAVGPRRLATAVPPGRRWVSFPVLLERERHPHADRQREARPRTRTYGGARSLPARRIFSLRASLPRCLLAVCTAECSTPPPRAAASSHSLCCCRPSLLITPCPSAARCSRGRGASGRGTSRKRPWVEGCTGRHVVSASAE